MSEKRSCLIGWLIIAGLFAGVFAAGYLIKIKIPTASDAEEATRVCTTLEQRYPFRQHRKRTVFCRPHPDYSTVIVHGGYTAGETDQIIEAARSVRREIATKPVHLQFFEGEASDDRYLTRTEIIP